jgi:hypothetical protein
VLVDAAGAEVPFWRATKVSADTRIAPGATAHETFRFEAAGAGTAEIAIAYRTASEAVAKRLGLAEVPEERLITATIAFDAKHTGKPVVVAPPAPGKRPKP